MRRASVPRGLLAVPWSMGSALSSSLPSRLIGSCWGGAVHEGGLPSIRDAWRARLKRHGTDLKRLNCVCGCRRRWRTAVVLRSEDGTAGRNEGRQSGPRADAPLEGAGAAPPVAGAGTEPEAAALLACHLTAWRPSPSLAPPQKWAGGRQPGPLAPDLGRWRQRCRALHLRPRCRPTSSHGVPALHIYGQWPVVGPEAWVSRWPPERGGLSPQSTHRP